MTDTASAAPSDAELFPLIEKHFGMVPRRDDTVIDRRTGRFHDAQRYRDFAADLLSARAQPTPPAVVEPMTDGLLQQHNRDSQELRRLCAARDQARSERDALKAEIAGLEASCSTLGRLVDELRPDAERLEWVLLRVSGTWLRAYLGVVSYTSDMDTLRMLIDANRGALAAHGIKKENGNG